MVTYCSIVFIPCKKQVSFTGNSGELIQVGTEQLWNKRIFTYFSYCINISISGAFFKINLADFYVNLRFRNDLCSNLKEN